MNLSIKFRSHVDNAINLLSINEGVLKDEEVLELFLANGVSYEEALEILLFLPIAFVRQLLPDVEWPDTYFESINHDQNEIKYSETESFLMIWEEVLKYFNASPDNDAIIKIAGRSSEFQAINKLLLNNPNLHVKDIRLTNTVVVR